MITNPFPCWSLSTHNAKRQANSWRSNEFLRGYVFKCKSQNGTMGGNWNGFRWSSREGGRMRECFLKLYFQIGHYVPGLFGVPVSEDIHETKLFIMTCIVNRIIAKLLPNYSPNGLLFWCLPHMHTHLCSSSHKMADIEMPGVAIPKKIPVYSKVQASWREQASWLGYSIFL